MSYLFPAGARSISHPATPPYLELSRAEPIDSSSGVRWNKRPGIQDKISLSYQMNDHGYREKRKNNSLPMSDVPQKPFSMHYTLHGPGHSQLWSWQGAIVEGGGVLAGGPPLCLDGASLPLLPYQILAASCARLFLMRNKTATQLSSNK